MIVDDFATIAQELRRLLTEEEERRRLLKEKPPEKDDDEIADSDVSSLGDWF